MEPDTTTTTDGRGEYVRPVEGRVLAGVSQGLANRLGIPVLVLRAFFVITSFAGGLGLALYAAGWALMRSEDETESPAEKFFGDVSSSQTWIGVGLIFIAALVLLDNLTFLSGAVVWAVGLLVIGVMLYTGRLPIGEARHGQPGDDIPPDTPAGPQPGPVAAFETSQPEAGTPPPPPLRTPPDLPATPPRPRRPPSMLGRLTIGLVIIGMGVMALLDNIDGLAMDAGPRHYLALAVTILGVGLMVGGFAGRARWLIIIAAVMVPTLIFSPVFEYDWAPGRFDATVNPDTFAELQPEYTVDVGSLVIDLTELPWDGETVELTAHVDAGELEIRVPTDVGLVGSATADVGLVEGLGRSSFGVGDPSLTFDRGGPDGTVVLDASVDVGNIDVLSR